jgi:hypothetical protein
MHCAGGCWMKAHEYEIRSVISVTVVRFSVISGWNSYRNGVLVLILWVLLFFPLPRFLCSLHLRIRISMYNTPRWRSWLRYCSTTRKVAGSIPDSATGIYHWHNPFGRTMALGSTQPLTEMSTRSISWGVKAAGAWGWQPYYLHVLIV